MQWFSTFGSWRPTKHNNNTQFGDPFISINIGWGKPPGLVMNAKDSRSEQWSTGLLDGKDGPLKDSQMGQV